MCFRMFLLFAFVACSLGQSKSVPLDFLPFNMSPNEIPLPHFSPQTDDGNFVLTEMQAKCKRLQKSKAFIGLAKADD